MARWNESIYISEHTSAWQCMQPDFANVVKANWRIYSLRVVESRSERLQVTSVVNQMRIVMGFSLPVEFRFASTW